MDTFNFQPNWGLNVQRKPEVMKIAFGDGYEQVAPKGLNHNLRTYSAVFTGTEARIKQIEAFLNDKAAIRLFFGHLTAGKRGNSAVKSGR